MLNSLPQSPEELLKWEWSRYESYFRELAGRPLAANNVMEWLEDWSQLSEHIQEQYTRSYLATAFHTSDEEAKKRLFKFLDTIYQPAMDAEQTLKKKLLASRLQPAGFEVTLRNMRAEADLFRQENLPLLAEEQKLGTQYDELIGAQTVQWEGQELTISQLKPVFQNPERDVREQAWRLAAERQLADRQAINELWQKFLGLRLKIAANAGKPDYRAYKWQEMLRFDYTPADCRQFHQAIEQVMVPAALRVYERRRQRLGVRTLRPWDLDVDPLHNPPLHPFSDVGELKAKTSTIFHQVDPQLGERFDIMVNENLLDLDNRKNKAPAAFCAAYAISRRPFIFMNAVGMHNDVQTLLHESGHAFHVFETAPIRCSQQLQTTMEFAEVASMSMELMASPYLSADKGGFYTMAEAARARIEHLEELITFWPYMAIVDAFQHWVYENPEKACDPAECDAAWGRLWQRFRPGIDWSGLEDEMVTGWHRKLHIFKVPFYYVEYGLAQLGAVQVWRNALKDQAAAIASYRHALSLGGTLTLPELYKAAGARLVFDVDALHEAVTLIEDTIEGLDVKL
ncbi:MAG: M3 family oligoendopeptidase [Chloroflexi bacterium]|nr:M3 family oligoendopeptidase [Chloroflexota bacterium]